MVFFYLWWYSRHKVTGVVLILIAIISVLLYAPAEYFNRMDTLSDLEEDKSAMGRIHAWEAGITLMTMNPLTGAGAGHFPGSAAKVTSHGGRYITAHSMYFLILGELGLPGIIFLLSLLLSNYFRNLRLFKQARSKPDNPESLQFARLFFLLNGSIIGFSVAGAFLSVAYYPHLYVLSGLCTASQLSYQHHLKSLEVDS